MTAQRPRRHRPTLLAWIVSVGFAAACGEPGAVPPAPPTLDLAVRILREGAAALPEDDPEVALRYHEWQAAHERAVGEHEPASLSQAARLGPSALRGFLSHPFVEPAVQWTCAGMSLPMEERLASLLGSGHDEDRALALAVLVHVRAPLHIVREWQVLQELDQRHGRDPVWSPLLAALYAPFAPNELEAVLRGEPPTDPYGLHRASEWAVRAVGVTGCRQLLARVVVWSRSANLNVALAAERSLHDFSGPDADRALADCLLGFGRASELAGDALLLRDPDLLIRSLLGAEVPAGERWFVGLLLAKLEHPAAVPHLCASVGSRAIIDRAMFAAIERLATVDHWPLVEALPSTVRSEQKERATAVVTAVRARLKL